MELYNEDYYRNCLGPDPYAFREPWVSFFDHVAERLTRLFQPESVLDAGCAIGLLVDAFQKQDVYAMGVDVSHYATEQASLQGVMGCYQGSLEDLSRFPRVDLLTCIEVLEHIPEELEEKVIQQLCSKTDRIVFSSTSTDFTEKTHVNVREQEHWVEKFRENGFELSNWDVSFICPWAKVFENAHKNKV